MVTINLKIDKVDSQQPKRWAIFTGLVIEENILSQRRESVFVPSHICALGTLAPGQWWQIKGVEQIFKGKKQIRAKEAYMLRPSGSHIIELLAGDSERFPGIGKAYAAKLFDKLGDQLAVVLNNNDYISLAAVMRELHIPDADAVALSVVKGWNELGIGEIISWLDGLPSTEKLGVKLVRKILNCWGSLARQKIEADPYRLIAFLSTEFPLITWKKVDEIAQNVFGIPFNDKRRLHGALMDSILSHYDDKNTVIDRKKLLKKMEDRLEDLDLAEKALECDYGSRTFLSNGEYWQARGAFLAEMYVAEKLYKLRSHKQYELFGEQPLDNKAFRSIISEFEKQEGYPLSDEQVHAIKICLDNSVSIIKGGAGVGKTSSLKCLYYIIEKQGGKVVQMALSGRAAHRMMEASRRPASTIAGFLVNFEDMELDEKTTVVIDESSMLCLPLMYQILKKLPLGCRLILVGDVEQLDPIGPGLVFHLLSSNSSGFVPMSELTKVYRQNDATGIPFIAREIREQRWPELPLYSCKGNGVSILPAKEWEVEDAVKQIYADLGGNDRNEDVQILSVIKYASPCSVTGINTYLQNLYASGKKRITSFNNEFGEWYLGAGGFAEGDPVMFTQNCWDRDLFNGSLGHFIEVYDPPEDRSKDPSLHVIARVLFDTGPQDITLDDLNNLELAYSITVHKSQGSQFQRVIIPIKKGKLLDKSLIYTAITRGIHQVVLVGDIDATKTAVETGAAVNKRQVGFEHVLNFIIKRELLSQQLH